MVGEALSPPNPSNPLKPGLVLRPVLLPNTSKRFGVCCCVVTLPAKLRPVPN